MRLNVRVRSDHVWLPRGTTTRIDIVYHHGAVVGEPIWGETGRTDAFDGLAASTMQAYQRAGVRQVVLTVECCNSRRIANFATLSKRPELSSMRFRRLSRSDTKPPGGSVRAGHFRTGLKALLDLHRQQPAAIFLTGFDFYAVATDDKHGMLQGFPGYYRNSSRPHQSSWHNASAELAFFGEFLATQPNIFIDPHLASVLRNRLGLEPREHSVIAHREALHRHSSRQSEREAASFRGTCSTFAQEEKLFVSRCAATIRTLDASRARLRWRHGLAITWAPGRKPWAPAANAWGVGHLLPLAYRLHAMCIRLARYCYLRLFDSELGTFFGYHGGASWDVEQHELAQYNGSHESLHFRCEYADSNGHEAFLGKLYRAVHRSSAPLVLLNVSGWMPFEKLSELGRPLIRSGMPVSSAAALHSWLRLPPEALAPDVLPASLLQLRGLSPCLCRYVTQWLSEPPELFVPSIARGSVSAPRSVVRRKPRMAVHLRTGFADAHDVIVDRVEAEESTAMAWASAACGAAAPGDALGSLHEPRLLVSDSPGLLQYFQRRHGARILLSTAANEKVATGPQARLQAHTRTWNVPSSVRKQGYADVLHLGFVELLHVAPQARYLRPEKRRQCNDKATQRGLNASCSSRAAWDLGVARLTSSFFRPALARSMCLQGVSIGVPSCPNWPHIFVRDLPSLLQPSAHKLKGLKRLSHFNSSYVVAPVKRQHSFPTLRNDLHEQHPCKHAKSLGECYRSFVAGLSM